MSKRSLPAILLVSALVASLSASGAAAQSPSASAASGEPVTLTIGSTSDLVSPNVFKACCALDYEFLFLNYDQLLNFDKDTLAATDGLAYYPPEESTDGKTWTFKIRTGVKWSDGVPLTAKDVAFTFNFIKDNHMGAFFNYLGDAKSFEAPDDETFIWRLNTPSTAPIAPPWLPIIPEHIWSRFDGKDAKTIKEFKNIPAVGSGAFNLTDWKPGQYMSLDANKDYWGGTPYIDRIVWKVYDNPEALKLALINGEIDAAEALPPAIFQQIQNVSNITTNVSNANYYDDLAFNFRGAPGAAFPGSPAGTADPSLQNLDVRKAIAYSIDKQALVDRVTLGYSSVGSSVILPTYTQWQWQPDASQTIGFSPEAAKSLLDSAGYKDTNGDGFRETPNGEPWSLQVLTITDLTYSVQEGKLIVGWMNDVGIKTSIKSVSESKAYDLWGAGDFDMYVWGWGAEPDPDSTLQLFIKSQCEWWSDGCYSDPAYEKMYASQHTTADMANRHDIVSQMQQFLYEQMPLVILLYEKDLQAYRNDRFTGFTTQPSPVGSIFYAFGPQVYLGIKPVSANQETASSSSSSGVPIWVWIALVVVVVILGGAFLARRGKSSEDTE
jgi:peptide/nickel transport system substrate-binding protein